MGDFNHINAKFRICIDSFDSNSVCGTAVSQRLVSALRFSDLGSLALDLDRILESQNFPQAFQRARSFSDKHTHLSPLAAQAPEDGMAADAVINAEGRVLTFDLAVLSRRNSSWQGNLLWSDGSNTDYNSVLELLGIIETKLAELKQ